MATYSRNTTTVEAYQASALWTLRNADVATLPTAILLAAIKGCIVFGTTDEPNVIIVRGSAGEFRASGTDWVLENGDLSTMSDAEFSANYTAV